MATVLNCPACQRPVSTEAPACPNCGHPFQKPRVRRSPIRTIVYLLIIAAGAYLAWRFWLPHEVREGAERLVTGGRQVLYDEKFGVPAKSYHATGFKLNREAEVEVSVTVEGDGVDLYVVSGEEWKKYEKAQDALTGGRFQHFKDFYTPRTQQTTRRARLGAGTYWVITENPTYGLLTRPSFDVHLRVVANP